MPFFQNFYHFFNIFNQILDIFRHFRDFLKMLDIFLKILTKIKISGKVNSPKYVSWVVLAALRAAQPHIGVRDLLFIPLLFEYAILRPCVILYFCILKGILNFQAPWASFSRASRLKYPEFKLSLFNFFYHKNTTKN